jgi:hypothetical protein
MFSLQQQLTCKFSLQQQLTFCYRNSLNANYAAVETSNLPFLAPLNSINATLHTLLYIPHLNLLNILQFTSLTKSTDLT